MGFKINREQMENDTGGNFTPELKCIPAGVNQARLVSYLELGKHIPMFMGKHAVYGKESKKAGTPKPPEFIIHLVFEFPRAEHTNEFPLTIKTSVPWGTGDFINKLSVSEAMMNGTISMSYANRSKFMKYLNAMNDACGTTHDGLAEFVGEAFMIAVTNKAGTKAREDGTLPVYSNMKPDGITSTTFPDPMGSGKDVTAEVPAIVGTYCPTFFWDEPTEEAWKAIPSYIQTCMKGAVDFADSPLAAMLAGMPEEPADEPADNKPADKTGTPAQAEDDIPV